MKTSDITIVTCSMNRTENLLTSLDSLKELKNIDKHLILDFSSDNEIKIDHELIKYSESIMKKIFRLLELTMQYSIWFHQSIF